MKPAGDLAGYIGGFVAAEGTFVRSVQRFWFAVGLAAADELSCELLATWFSAGALRRYRRRKTHYDDEATFTVGRLRDLVEVIVPFMDEHLPSSYKREQYMVWRAELLEYWQHSARRRRPCSVDGCDERRRAQGVCRLHYYVRFGK